MIKELHHTIKFAAHVQQIMSQHFRVDEDINYLKELDEEPASARQFIRQIFLPPIKSNALTA